MAYSYQDMVSDGSTTQVQVAINFIDRSHLSVLVNGVLTAYTWLSPSVNTIVLGAAPAAGSVIRIKRTTPRDKIKYDYSKGSQFSTATVDANNLQLLYIDQEIQEELAAVYGSVSVANLYLGPSATPPTVTPGGLPVSDGMMYYNTVDARIYVKTPDGWRMLTPTSAIAVANTIATAGQTVFNTPAPFTPGTNTVEVWVNGARINIGTDYTEATGGTSITLTAAASVGDKVAIRVIQTLAIGSTAANLVTASDGASGSLFTTVAGFISRLMSSAGAALVGFIQTGTGSVMRSMQDRLRETTSIKDYGAVGDGQSHPLSERFSTLTAAQATYPFVTSLEDEIDWAALQAACFYWRGKLTIPKGTFMLSRTVVIPNEVILVGQGAGAYFQGGGYGRVSVFKPTASFIGADVFRADPADDGAGAIYRYGVAFRDFLIDCINIKNRSGTILRLMSLTNSETSDSIRVINNNNNVGLRVGMSTNAGAFESDGLLFTNFYFLQADADNGSVNPVAVFGPCNEVTVRDTKFQRGASGYTVGSVAVVCDASQNGITGKSVNAVTLDACSYAGAETGLRVLSNASDGQGARNVRNSNATFEGVKYPMYLSGTPTRPTQFCSLGPGNRVLSLVAGGRAITLDIGAANNMVYADDIQEVLCGTGSANNTVFGGADSSVVNGVNNIRIANSAGQLATPQLVVPNWNTPTLGSGWTNASPSNRTTAAYRKDAMGNVQLRGYLSGGSWGYPNYIFTLPSGYRPSEGKTYEMRATGDTTQVVKVFVDPSGNVWGTGTGAIICLDGIYFPTT